MNLLLLFPDDLIGDERALVRGRRYDHLCRVLGVRVGDHLRAGLEGGRMGAATVRALRRQEIELAVDLDQEPPPPLPVHLLLALPRPKAIPRLVETITAMGVKRLTLLNAWRVEKSYWQSPVLTPERLRRHAVLGLEQARDTILPEIDVERLFRPFIEDRAPAMLATARGLVAHPGAARPCLHRTGAPTVLAVGPEGGFVPYEIDAFVRAGFSPFQIGPRILRVEQVVPALLGPMGPIGPARSHRSDRTDA